MSGLPKGWVETTLGNVADLYQPKTISKSEMCETGEFQVFGANGIIGRYTDFNHQDSEVIITCRGATCGSVSMTPTLCWITGNAMVVHPDESIMSKRYLYHALKGAVDLRSTISGSAQPQITRTSLSPSRIPIAPRAEQDRIVAAIEEQFSRLDAAEASLRRAQRNVERMRRAVLASAFEGDWPTKPLGDLLSAPLSNGRSVPTAVAGFPVLRLTALRNRRIDLNERKIGAWTRTEALPFLVKRGDFFIARGNGSLALVGRGGLVDTEPDEVAYPDTMIRVRADAKYLQGTFLRLIWDSPQIRRQLECVARTTAGIYKVNQKDLGEIELPVPPLNQQHETVAQVDQQLSLVGSISTAIDHSLTRSSHLRRSILQQAFTGQLVPQDPNDEPASVLLERIASSQVPVRPVRKRGTVQ